MPTKSPLGSELSDLYDAESSRLHHDFSTTKNGLNFLRERSALVESVVLRLTSPLRSSQQSAARGIALLALGDFGRNSLFPCSDIDLLFLLSTQDQAAQWAGAIQQFVQGMAGVGLNLNTTI